MSSRYLGGFITDTPTQPTASVAKGIWTLSQQSQAKGNSIWPMFKVGYRYWKVVAHPDTSHFPRISRFVMENDAGPHTTIQTYVSDNCSDSGTIPNDGDAFTYDFTTPQIITKVGFYSVYTGGARQGKMDMYYSSNNSTFTLAQANIICNSNAQCGVLMFSFSY